MPHFCYLCVRAPKVKEDLDDVVENEEPIKYFKKINVVKGTKQTLFWKICCSNLVRRWESRLVIELKRKKTQTFQKGNQQTQECSRYEKLQNLSQF